MLAYRAFLAYANRSSFWTARLPPQMGNSNIIDGPIGEAAGVGTGIGLVGGYIVGAFASVFRDVDPIQWSAHGAGLVGTFAVALVLWPRIGL